MARVEVSQNIGPHVVKSLDGVSSVATHTSTAFLTETYTVHSYQVILSFTAVAPTDITFKIYATNDDDKNYQIIASYTIDAANNSDGIMYSDVWNFKHAKCEVAIANIGSVGSVSVIEKHNP
jgi:hypothetical protein